MLSLTTIRGLGGALAAGGLLVSAAVPAHAEDSPAVKAAETGNPQLVEAIHLGNQFMGSNLFDKAAEKFQEAARLDPENPEVYSLLGYSYLRAENFEQAVKTYRRYVELLPEDCKSHQSLGFAFMRQGLTDQAIVSYETALKLCPDDPTAYTSMAQAYTEAGYEVEAIEAYRHAVELNPNDVLSYENLGSLYYNRKMYPESIATYEAILALPAHGKDDDWVLGAKKRLGLMYKWAENCEKAAMYYRAVLDAEPDNVTAARTLASCYEKSGQTVDAIRAYGRLIELEQDKPLYYYRLADLLNDVGQYDKALRTIRTGRQYDTECSAHAHAVSGRALEKTGEFKKAEREYRKCVECNDPALTGYCTQQIERQQQLAKIEDLKKAKAKQGY